MKKIVIVAASTLRFSPYIKFYSNIFEDEGIDYELIVPNRSNDRDSFSKRVNILSWSEKKSTLQNYIVYSKEVFQYIKNADFDGLIILTAQNAVFMSRWLAKKFNKKYIVDIRDYSHENVALYRKLEEKSIKNAYATIVSSRKFNTFLPRGKYYICNNIGAYSSEQHQRTLKISKHFPIVIGYVGGLNPDYIEQNKGLMKLVANDERFALHYYGKTSENSVYVNEANLLNCDRIHFFGEYKPSEKESIIDKVDILNNAYGFGIPLLDTALSNKLFDSLYFQKPIITCPTTYMQEMAGPLGYPIDFTTSKSLDGLYNWYVNLNSDEIDVYCKETMNSMAEDNLRTRRMILEFLNS